MHGSPSIPPHFRVPAPWYFRIRPDLLEELCYFEELGQSVPCTDSAYRLKRWALPVWDWHWDETALRRSLLQDVKLPERVLLQAVVLPGENEITAAVIDRRGWWTEVQYSGLFASVFERAAWLMRQRGLSESEISKLLDPRTSKSFRHGARVARVSVGYDRQSARCSLLVSGVADSDGAFVVNRRWRWCRITKARSS